MVNKDSIRYKDPTKREEYQRKRSKIYMRTYRKHNPDKIKQWEKNRKRNRNEESKKKFLLWQSKRRHEFKNKLDKIKIDIGRCNLCGYKEHPEILQFHHRNKELKRFQLSTGNLGSYKWETILEEIDKCNLICPNCHSLIHYNETRKI